MDITPNQQHSIDKTSVLFYFINFFTNQFYLPLCVIVRNRCPHLAFCEDATWRVKGLVWVNEIHSLDLMAGLHFVLVAHFLLSASILFFFLNYILFGIKLGILRIAL